MKTIGDYKIIWFKKLEKPIERHPLKPLIYTGLVKNVPLIIDKPERFEDMQIYWDEEGRVSNKYRYDCNIPISELEKKLKLLNKSDQ